MFEPRIVYACNHYIVENYNESMTITVTGGDMVEDDVYRRKDVLIPNAMFLKDGVITVQSAECMEAQGIETLDDGEDVLILSTNCKTYYLNEHFDIGYEMRAENNNEFKQYIYIKWLKGDFDLPNLYSAEMCYIRTISNLYDKNNCPRCNGDGWYAGIFESGNVNPSKVSDKNKLVQTFLKYIYTKKTDTGYGTRLTEVPGKYDLVEQEFINIVVRDEIMSFSKFYTDKISSMMLKGYSFSDGEILKAMSVSDIEIDVEEMQIKVTVTFLTADGSRNAVDLMVANL